MFIRGRKLHVVGVRSVFLGLFLISPLGLVIDLDGLGRLRRGRRSGGLDHRDDRVGLDVGIRRRAHFVGVLVIMFMIMGVVMVMMIAVIVMVVVVMLMVLGRILGMILDMRMVVRLMLVTLVRGHVVIVGLGRDRLLERLVSLRLRVGSSLDHLALDAVAVATAAGVAMAGAAAMTAVLVLFLGLAMRALVGLNQRLTVGDRDLIVVGMNFAEGQEAVAIAAIFDEGGLQRRLYARDLGEINVAAQLLALGGLEIKLFDSIATDHDDPGLFRVGGIDQHLVGHFAALDGGGRGSWRAQTAPPGDATVHLIRG
nr:hypothetical protein [Bradyrhizobium ivorense]